MAISDDNDGIFRTLRVLSYSPFITSDNPDPWPNLEQRVKRLEKGVSRKTVHLVLKRSEHSLVGSTVLDGDVGAENGDERLDLDQLAVDRGGSLGVPAAGLLANLLDRIAFGKDQKKVFRGVVKRLLKLVGATAHPALRLPIVKELLSLFL